MQVTKHTRPRNPVMNLTNRNMLNTMRSTSLDMRYQNPAMKSTTPVMKCRTPVMKYPSPTICHTSAPMPIMVHMMKITPHTELKATVTSTDSHTRMWHKSRGPWWKLNWKTIIVIWQRCSVLSPWRYHIAIIFRYQITPFLLNQIDIHVYLYLNENISEESHFGCCLFTGTVVFRFQMRSHMQ